MHNPTEYIRGLQQLLVSDKKRIGFLFGAGTSLAKKNKNSKTVPAIGEMTRLVIEELSQKVEYEKAILEITSEIGQDEFNIESFLSNIEIKNNIIGNGCLNGLKKDDFEQLIIATKNQIIKIVSIHNKIKSVEEVNSLIHCDFAEWVGRSNRKYPIEIFTTNYDYLFEIGLEEKNIPYYDGFTGSYQPFFNSNSVEKLDFLPTQTKLWKIHGSLGWKLESISKKVIRKEPTEEDIIIYPSQLKYSNCKKQPYLSLMDRLYNFLKHPDTLLIVCGYSFSDEHINERIITALKSNPLAHVCAFLYDRFYENNKRKYSLSEDTSIAKLARENSNLSIFGCRTAVLGCKYGIWKLNKEPDRADSIDLNVYFDEDAYSSLEDTLNEQVVGKEIWTGEGELKLVDFVSFVDFLKSMIIEY